MTNFNEIYNLESYYQEEVFLITCYIWKIREI